MLQGGATGGQRVVYMCCIHHNNHLSFGLPVRKTLNMPWCGPGVALGVAAGGTWQWLALCECAWFELRSNLGWLAGRQQGSSSSSEQESSGWCTPPHSIWYNVS
jgi:hypothetical protein